MSKSQSDIRAKFAGYGDYLLFADDFDDAIIGVTQRCGSLPLVAYDKSLCIAILEGYGMDYDEALEFFDFNVAGTWAGPYTPVFIDRSALE